MSRVGKAPIRLPSGVTVNVTGRAVAVKGPKGQLKGEVPKSVEVVAEGSTVTVKRTSESNAVRAIHGTTRALIANMVTGVSKGFAKNLDIIGVGYSAEVKGKKLVLKLGYSHPVEYVPPAGVEIEVPEPTRIVVRGIDSQLVGQSAADIRAFRPPEPYKGKGIRYHDEHVKRKAGKLAVSAGI
jgi:large subunit ribosomal protein L6